MYIYIYISQYIYIYNILFIYEFFVCRRIDKKEKNGGNLCQFLAKIFINFACLVIKREKQKNINKFKMYCI